MTPNNQPQGKVEAAIEQGIGTIAFSHPKSNSLPGILLKELSEAITRMGQDEEVKVIILKSGGDRAFCAGASFDELLGIADFDAAKEFFMGFARVINAVRNCPKFVIGRVQGKAVGGGVGVAAAVDYCLATDTASVKLSELSIGFGPFVVAPAIERKLGFSAFSRLAVNATEWKEAHWAKEKGLFMDVFSSVNELDVAVNSLAEKLAKSNPEAMALLKKTMWEGTENWDKLLEERAAMSGKLMLSKFTADAINQFRNSAKG